MAATKKPNGESTVAPERIRAFWAERQGLAGAMKGASASEVFARTGWARSVGGCNPYLALRDRAALSRASVDEAVAKLQIHELPSARGCTYVVPKDDYAIALRASQGHGDDASMAMATKFLGVTVKEIDRLCDRVLQLVAKTPLDPAGIKEAAGDAVRSLGPEGKKRGTTSTLPLALGRLQTHGLIRRVPTDGRLDQQRYRYVAWTPSPLGKKVLGDDEVAMELGRRFFRWTGPATVAQLAWWGGLGVKAARGVAAELKLATLEEGSDRYLFQDDKDALLAMTLPREPRISFVSRASTTSSTCAEKFSLTSIVTTSSAESPARRRRSTSGRSSDLPYHPIIDRGRVIGLWDWDGVSGKLAWRTFAKTPSVDKAVAKEGEALTEYVKRELGDARSFSLDSPESRVERIEELAKAKW